MKKKKLIRPSKKKKKKKKKKKQPTTGPSPYLIAPAPPTGTQSGGDLSSSQPFWRDPNQIGLPFPPPGAAEPPGPRQGVSPPVGGSNNNGTDPSSGSPSPAPSPSPSNGTSPGNETAPIDNGNGNRNSTLTRGAQLLLPPADPRRSDPFAALAAGVAGALLPPVLAAKAVEVANAAAAKVFAKKAGKNKKKKPSKFCPLSPADRDLLRTATGAALGAGAEALAGSATPLELSRCAVTLRETRPAAFQWVLFSGGRINPCSIVLGE